MSYCTVSISATISCQLTAQDTSWLTTSSWDNVMDESLLDWQRCLIFYVTNRYNGCHYLMCWAFSVSFISLKNVIQKFYAVKSIDHRQPDIPSVQLVLVDVSSDNVTIASCGVQDLEPLSKLRDIKAGTNCFHFWFTQCINNSTSLLNIFFSLNNVFYE